VRPGRCLTWPPLSLVTSSDRDGPGSGMVATGSGYRASHDLNAASRLRANRCGMTPMSIFIHFCTRLDAAVPVRYHELFSFEKSQEHTVPTSRFHRAELLRYYLYISDSKLDMLFDQIDRGLLKRISPKNSRRRVS
jgi:hypothetical protein